MDEIKKNQIYALIQNDIKVFYKNRFLPLFKRYIDSLGASEPIPRDLLSADFGLYEIACPEEAELFEEGLENLCTPNKVEKKRIETTIKKTFNSIDTENGSSNI